MPELMIFKDVVEQNGIPLLAKVKEKGSYDRGKWIEAQPVDVPFIGVVLPLSLDDLKYVENGVYTVKEKKLLTVTSLPAGSEVMYKDEPYTVQAFKDLTDYTDVHIYLMRYREKGATS